MSAPEDSMKPIKCIQRNAHPIDAYNDGSAVIPTGPERSGSIANAVVERCGSRTDAAHWRMRMEREALTPENVHTADTVSLLRARARARTLRAKYEPIRRCHENCKVHNCNFSSPEGGGSDADRIIAL